MTKVHLVEDFTAQITQIIPSTLIGTGGLYLGNYQGTKNKEILQKHNITAVLSLMSQKTVQLTSFKISHLQIRIDDTPLQNIQQHLSNCIDFISKYRKTGNVFVHCVAGISRSATVVIAYLMKYKRYSLNHALNKVKRRRNIVNPNKGFLLQLEQFQKTIDKGPGEKSIKNKPK